MLNVVNSEQPLTYFTSNDSPNTVNTPITYQRPRNYEAGFRIDFQVRRPRGLHRECFRPRFAGAFFSLRRSGPQPAGGRGTPPLQTLKGAAPVLLVL